MPATAEFYNLGKQIEIWQENQPDNNYHKQLLKVYNILLNEVHKNGANLKHIRNIEIVSSLSAYIAFQICSELNIDIIGWFSDSYGCPYSL
ncbi:hypothetical protein [Photobacterium iliopiscarium]|uniref:hypothetical protein n=1 Tax=Photobacterium iliopiscarium TaxID=56192 RepID=UPI0005D37C48|nr:hypothetical protein [Photobacterium iliopiscarium]KJG12702.1 hypothetical protein UB38_13485 [Photobacterium iliopiscarium]PSU00505.1 hypothetical protein C9I85_06360 [Photobacterium iliopiscarium]PSV83250.1 hypothetical protein C9J51_08030 [Photobacterium iliopiscarium]